MSLRKFVKICIEPPFYGGSFFFFYETLVVFCVFSCYTQSYRKSGCEVVFLWNRMSIQKEF